MLHIAQRMVFQVVLPQNLMILFGLINPQQINNLYQQELNLLFVYNFLLLYASFHFPLFQNYLDHMYHHLTLHQNMILKVLLLLLDLLLNKLQLYLVDFLTLLFVYLLFLPFPKRIPLQFLSNIKFIKL